MIEGKLLYKSDGSTSCFIAGIPDICEAGCLIVDNIRVPSPTCTMHSETRLQNKSMLYLEF
jgi:hypothetical protein